ncbi:MAG: hypothetical protein KDD36_12105 [Flavobacteriales bacterium]|nr:hypothetical protein [Flavobacteriales bacterium]
MKTAAFWKERTWLAFALAALVFRTWYGCTLTFRGEDYLHTYLIGLKFFTTGVWPWFGPDVVHTNSQIPGALEGLLVGGPFFVWSNPVSPLIFLNLISFIALTVFGAYLIKRFPSMPRWFVWAWLWFSPWTLNFSTTPINPSYVLWAAIPFIITLIEGYVGYTQRLVAAKPGFFIIGLCIGWTMQLHLSWVLMPCLTFPLFILEWKKKGTVHAMALTGLAILGLAISLSTLYPTLIRYGSVMSGGVESNIQFHAENLKNLPDLFFRAMGFASFEILQFLPGGQNEWKSFFTAHPVLSPITIVLVAAGLIQSIYLLIAFFLRNQRPEWKSVRLLTAAVLVFLYISYLFSIRSPGSMTFYMLLPLLVWYAFYPLENLMQKVLWRRIAMILLAVNLTFHVGLAYAYLPEHSLQSHYALVQEAMEKQDSRLLDFRRVATWEWNLRDAAWKATYQASDNGAVLVFTNNFEYEDEYIRPETLYDTVSASPPWACRIDSTYWRSIRFVRYFRDIRYCSYVRVALKSYCLNAPRARLVLRIYEGDEDLMHHEHEVCSGESNDGKWIALQFGHEVQKTIPYDAIVEAYVEIPPPEKGTLYIDDFEVSFVP